METNNDSPEQQSADSKLAAALAYLGPKWVLAPERRVTKQRHKDTLNQWKKERRNEKL